MKDINIREIRNYKPEFEKKLSETFKLLKSSKLVVHPKVHKITLHGSRGLSGGYRVDSDIDLCLITDIVGVPPHREETELLLKEILQTTLDNSRCPAELDLAAIFDTGNCSLICFNTGDYELLKCDKEATGCMGIYKIQKGFNGFVPPILDVEKMYPFVTIWERQQ
jgi:hypothetical protein